MGCQPLGCELTESHTSLHCWMPGLVRVWGALVRGNLCELSP